MITSSAVAQRLNRLEGRGLVGWNQNADDARATDVTLTAAGSRGDQRGVTRTMSPTSTGCYVVCRSVSRPSWPSCCGR